MRMPPPPPLSPLPPPPRRMPPPPPPASSCVPAEPDDPLISPDMTYAALESAIWIHGGYPQRPWGGAVRVLAEACAATPFRTICPCAVRELDKTIPQDVDIAPKGFDF